MWMNPEPEKGSPVHGLTTSAKVNGTCVSTEGGSSVAASGADSDVGSVGSHDTAGSSTTRTAHDPERQGILERNVGIVVFLPACRTIVRALLRCLHRFDTSDNSNHAPMLRGRCKAG